MCRTTGQPAVLCVSGKARVLPQDSWLYLVFQGKRVSYHAVYDGHGGIDAVQYTLQHLHLNIAKSTHYLLEPARAIEEGFILTDKNFVQKANREVTILHSCQNIFTTMLTISD